MRHSTHTTSCCRSASHWEHESTMLASSMMIVSISEDEPQANVGYKSRLCHQSSSSSSNDSQRIGSGSRLSGWGSEATRKSCKAGLCSLMAMADEEDNQDSIMSGSSNSDSMRLQTSAQNLPEYYAPSSHNYATLSNDQNQEGWGFFTAEGFGQTR